MPSFAQPETAINIASMLRRGAVAWAVHAALTAGLWFWMLGLTGLGFRDKAAWTTLESLQAEVVPTVALALSTPGRFILDVHPSNTALVGAWLGNSLLWAIVAVCGWSAWKRVK